MKALLKTYWPHLLVAAAPLVYIAAVWPQIPDRVPVHFNLHFKPDGYMGKLAGTLLLPVTSLFVTALVMTWFRFDPKMAKCDPHTREQVQSVLRKCMLAMNALLSVLAVGIVYASWGNLTVVAQTIKYGVPLLLLILGNYLGKLKPNYVIGIRCPWTLESPEVWSRTHRFSGRILVAMSLGLIGMQIVGIAPATYTMLLLGGLLVWTLLSLGYAFVISRKLGGSGNEKAVEG